MAELRQSRLYCSTHKTFEEYCRVRPWRWRSHRFGHSRQKSNYLIAAAQVYENLTTNCCQNSEIDDLTTNGSQILPSSEGQVRPLANLEPQQQQQAWQRAVEKAGGKVPSGRIVKEIVEQLKDKPLFSACDFCQVGDVFTICKLEGTERKYNNCWAIAVALNDFSIEVDVHDTTLTVKPENLNKIDSPEAHR
ncbi:hypothetical protein NIES4103_29430 [Nostoc sp. NIES-4103]|nr:hypothetical protein NIES4103_29430 [Nostoc sp. NIES-4103]